MLHFSFQAFTFIFIIFNNENNSWNFNEDKKLNFYRGLFSFCFLELIVNKNSNLLFGCCFISICFLTNLLYFIQSWNLINNLFGLLLALSINFFVMLYLRFVDFTNRKVFCEISQQKKFEFLSNDFLNNINCFAIRLENAIYPAYFNKPCKKIIKAKSENNCTNNHDNLINKKHSKNVILNNLVKNNNNKNENNENPNNDKNRTFNPDLYKSNDRFINRGPKGESSYLRFLNEKNEIVFDNSKKKN